ncbi:uncharacterized protein DUF2867 [Roseinatronobacter thiooxidans]|uniref:Uncharacterized protein DUF2867 n=1 Tax=Roseinatronobacter thiooxidans TaxID=121821 RepID=A0A2W7QDN2_9RHOB|nr:DUF2867 domain-containing protein [Roseinatronobacter thiooxidans]PZX46664.1 uncharacterized protein DUF2867 [Roseinatronobacter thiooxidans]
MSQRARTLGPPEALDYYDVRQVQLPVSLTPLEVWNLIMRDPQPVLRVAFAVRDAISARFGVKRIGGFSGQAHESVQVGAYLDFFLVEHIGPDFMLLTERDRHLDVMTCIACDNGCVTVTSSVVTHNLYGRIYMLPVGLAHKWIVSGMLRRLKRRLQR